MGGGGKKQKSSRGNRKQFKTKKVKKKIRAETFQ
jgi:hypothetical protein